MKFLNPSERFISHKSSGNCHTGSSYYSIMETLLQYTNQDTSYWNGYANKNYRDKIVVFTERCKLNKEITEVHVPVDYVNYGSTDEVFYVEDDNTIMQIAVNYGLEYLSVAMYQRRYRNGLRIEFIFEFTLDAEAIKELFPKKSLRDFNIYNNKHFAKKLFNRYYEII